MLSSAIKLRYSLRNHFSANINKSQLWGNKLSINVTAKTKKNCIKQHAQTFFIDNFAIIQSALHDRLRFHLLSALLPRPSRRQPHNVSFTVARQLYHVSAAGRQHVIRRVRIDVRRRIANASPPTTLHATKCRPCTGYRLCIRGLGQHEQTFAGEWPTLRRLLHCMR